MMIWQNSDGTLALMAFAVEPITPEEIAATRDKVVAKGKFSLQQYCGMAKTGELPSDNRYSRAWRWSAGAVVVKLNIAKEEEWRQQKEEAKQKLEATMYQMMEEMEANGFIPRQSPLKIYRDELRAIIAVKPQAIVDAKNPAELKANRPSVLDKPVP